MFRPYTIKQEDDLMETNPPSLANLQIVNVQSGQNYFKDLKMFWFLCHCVCNLYCVRDVLKVLTHKSLLFRIRFYTPKGPQKDVQKNFFPVKETLKNYFENPSGLSPNLAGFLLLSLYGSHLLTLLSPILRGS